MFEIIFIVVLIVAFLNLSGRIGRLEQLVKKGGLDENKKEGTSETAGESPVFKAMTSANPLETLSQKMPPEGKVAAPLAPAFSASRAVTNEEEGGRWLAKIGIVALLLGVSFFLKYAFDNNLIGVVGRVILGLI